ncbi:MAG: hypothetical protein R6X32_15800, partial [Chloroflexota bacterium]
LGMITSLTDEEPSSAVPRSASNTLPVELVWQADAETAVSYRVFLHLVGPDGTLVAQSDGEPAQWQRPTTGWLPGEIIGDAHQLHLPPELQPGSYTLLAGLYEPVSGERLVMAGGETAVVVASWVWE